jgi:hypothetical protein
VHSHFLTHGADPDRRLCAPALTVDALATPWTARHLPTAIAAKLRDTGLQARLVAEGLHHAAALSSAPG